MKSGKSQAGSFDQTCRLARRSGTIRERKDNTPLHELEADAQREDLPRAQRRYLARLIRRRKAKTPGTTPRG